MQVPQMDLGKTDTERILALEMFFDNIKWNNTALTVMTAILSFARMVGSMILLCKINSAVDLNWKLPVLFPLSYMAIVFLILLLIEHNRIPESPMRIPDRLMWSIYITPSFIIVIALVALVIVALGCVG